MRQVDQGGVPVSGILAGVFVAGGIACLGWIVANAPRLHDERAAALVLEIAGENTEACGRLGLGPERGAEIFGACARELDAVRLREHARLESPLL